MMCLSRVTCLLVDCHFCEIGQLNSNSLCRSGIKQALPFHEKKNLFPLLYKQLQNAHLVYMQMHRLIIFTKSKQIHDTTQTGQTNSHDLDYNTPPRVLQKRESSTQSRSNTKGRPLTPTKYRSQSQKPLKTVTTARSPYLPEQQ